MSEERYIQTAQKLRNNKSGFCDEKLDKCLDGLKKIQHILENVREGTDTILGGCRDNGLNMNRVRTVMYDVGKIYEQEREGYGYGDAIELLTPVEKFYCQVFNCGLKTTEVTEVMPPDAAEIFSKMITGYEKYGLTEREAKVLKYRFADCMNLEDCGKEFGVTRESIRQVEAKALRKLRHPIRSNVLRYGEEYEKRLEEDYERKVQERIEQINNEIKVESDPRVRELLPKEEKTAEIGICDLNLSVRSYNCLKRAGYNTLQDVITASLDDLKKIRNLGRKSLDEIITRVREYDAEFLKGEFYE